MKLIEYEWRLRDVMSESGMYKTTSLIKALEERGVQMSSSQVYRLVTEIPERLNMRALVALMDIFGCSADDLIRPVPLGAVVQTTGTDTAKPESSGEVLRGTGARPRRAVIVSGDDD